MSDYYEPPAQFIGDYIVTPANGLMYDALVMDENYNVLASFPNTGAAIDFATDRARQDALRHKLTRYEGFCRITGKPWGFTWGVTGKGTYSDWNTPCPHCGKAAIVCLGANTPGKAVKE